MKIILEYDENRRVEIDTTAIEIHEVLEEIIRVLIAYGFHPDTVKRGFIEQAEELDDK